MGCNCKWTEIVIALVILVVNIWPQLLGANVSWWLTVIASVLLLLHAFSCKNVCMPNAGAGAKVSRAKPARKVKRRKRR